MFIIWIWVHIVRIYIKFHQSDRIKRWWKHNRHIICCVDADSCHVSACTGSYVRHVVVKHTPPNLCDNILIVKGLEKSECISSTWS